MGFFSRSAFTWRTRRSARARSPGDAQRRPARASVADLGRVALEEGLRGRGRGCGRGRGGPARRVRASTTSRTSPSTRLSRALEVAGRRRPRGRSGARATAARHRASSMRRRSVGTMAAASSMSVCTSPGTARAWARSAGLLHDDEAQRALLAHDLARLGDPGVRVDAREAAHHLEGGDGPGGRLHDLPPLDLESAARSCRVAGSKTGSVSRWPSREASAARRRGRFSCRAGARRGRGSPRAPRRRCGCARSSRRPSTRARDLGGTGAGVEGEGERAQGELAVHPGHRGQADGVAAPSRLICRRPSSRSS